MRTRGRILDNLEDLYRRAFESAEEDRERQEELDFAFQRDQLYLELLLDLRDLLAAPPPETEDPESLLEKAGKLKKLRALTRLRP